MTSIKDAIIDKLKEIHKSIQQIPTTNKQYDDVVEIDLNTNPFRGKPLPRIVKENRSYLDENNEVVTEEVEVVYDEPTDISQYVDEIQNSALEFVKNLQWNQTLLSDIKNRISVIKKNIASSKQKPVNSNKFFKTLVQSKPPEDDKKFEPEKIKERDIEGYKVYVVKKIQDLIGEISEKEWQTPDFEFDKLTNFPDSFETWVATQNVTHGALTVWDKRQWGYGLGELPELEQQMAVFLQQTIPL